MRDYGAIYSGFWANESLRAAGDEARMLAAYLLTSPHTTTLGAFRLPDAYACEDLGWTAEQFRNGLETLESIGFVKHDKSTRIVWVIKFLTWNKPANPNIWKAIQKSAVAIPDAVPFKDEILISAGLFETVSEPLANTPSPSPSPSPSPLSATAELSDIALPLNDGSDYAVTLADIAEFEMAYPGIDVAAELRKARAWCVTNAAQRKTRRGIGKFMSGWLSRAAERPASASRPAPGGQNVIPLEQRPGGGRRAL